MGEGKLADPGPLGIMGFCMTTILLNIHNAGFYPVASVILEIIYLAMAEVIAARFGRKVLPYRDGRT